MCNNLLNEVENNVQDVFNYDINENWYAYCRLSAAVAKLDMRFLPDSAVSADAADKSTFLAFTFPAFSHFQHHDGSCPHFGRGSPRLFIIVC